MTEKTAVDQLLLPRWLIPLESADSADRIHENHGVAIDSGEIVAVGPREVLEDAFEARDTRTLPNHALIPGLVNAHTHSAMTLLRGYADDLPLMEWLNEHIWPAEAKWVNREFVETGTDLAIAEMLRGGTTCFNDMYFFPDATAARAEQAGIRVCVGMIVLDFPTVWASDSDEYISKGLELRDTLRFSNLVSTVFAPHAPYTVSDDPLERIAMLSGELDSRVHIHLHETNQEIEESTARFNMRPIERLEQLGLLNERLSAVHMTHLLDGEIESIAERGVSVIHCPESNMKLASGYCPTERLHDAGVNLAIGTDGASSNNDLDMVGELRSAALLAKAVAERPGAMNAPSALYAATMGGAIAMGLEHQIGSISVGKQADLAAMDLSDPATLPVYNPISQIVYAAGRHQISDVWVAGKPVVRDGVLTTLDVKDIADRASAWGLKIADGRAT